jgi:hypothetical protein
MKLSRLIAIVLANAATGSMLGCATDVAPTDPSGTVPAKPAVEAPAAFTLSTHTSDHLAGSVAVGLQPVTFDVRVGTRDVVRAEIEDTLGNVVVAVVHADGTRHVRYNGHRISVRPDGSVAAESFVMLPHAMRTALGLVPLDLACDASDADARMMEAAALPYNLLQRAAVHAKAPEDLMGQSTCVDPGITAATTSVAHDVLVRSKLVVAQRRGT